MTSKLSVTIISFNEESNIKQCVKSAQFADEIIVVDSFSSDRTKEIAESLGAKVLEHAFEGYGQQKNYAADQATYDWILNIDADEVITEDLKKSVLEAINQDKTWLFKTTRLTNYCGKWIRHGGWYPNNVNRLYNRKYAKWSEPNLHEELYLLNGTAEIPVLKGDLLHYSFPTVKSQVLTNVKYAELGSYDLVERKGKPGLVSVLYRPFIKFIECYFVKFGFLDGKEGLVIALNASYSMFMKYSFAYFRR